MQSIILALALGSSLALAQSGREPLKPPQASVRGRVMLLEESGHLLASGQDGASGHLSTASRRAMENCIDS